MNNNLENTLPVFNQEGIYFMALGGAEEVGFNMYAYAVNGRIIIVDCGYGFLNDDFFSSPHG